MTPLRASIIGVLVALLLVIVVFELVRRRRLGERYALLWFATGLSLLVLSAWRSSVNAIAGLLGVSYAPTIIFAVAAIFLVLVLLHVSVVLTRLADQNRALTQQLALLEIRVNALSTQRGENESADG